MNERKVMRITTGEDGKRRQGENNSANQISN